MAQSKRDAAPNHLMRVVSAQANSMEREIFLEHYRICRNDGGSPKEIARAGEVISYKAEGISAGQPFTLQLIPTKIVDLNAREQFEEQARNIQALDHVHIARLIAFGVEDDHFVFISEYLPGETVESWVTAHGPIPPDAVLRIALQVMSALTAAANHGLMHRAIQPSNLTIVPGETAEGGWPFVKLTNFTPAGVPLESGQFASPEQSQDGTVDFRSEIYSLGATMCFLLSGLARPLDARLRQIDQFPKPLRNLLAEMLRPNPDDRPEDSLLFAEALRTALRQVERRQTFRRRLGIPLAGTISPRTRAPILRRALVFASLLLAAGAIAAVLLPGDVVRNVWHRSGDAKQIGVPIGLPETPMTPSPRVVAAPTVAPTPEARPAFTPAVVAQEENAESSPARSTSTPLIVAREENVEPSPPAKGPEASPPVEEQDVASADTDADAEPSVAPDVPAETSPRVTTNRQESSTTSPRARVTQTTPTTPRQAFPRSTTRSGSFTAVYVGTTSDGRLIFRLPNGQLKYMRPRYHRFRHYPIERRAPDFERPYQPFD
jgi:serine/threonine-protein kinase